MTEASTFLDDQTHSVWQMTIHTSIQRWQKLGLFTCPHGKYTTAGLIFFVLSACFTSFYSILSCTFVIVAYKEILEDDVFKNIYRRDHVGAGIFKWLKPHDDDEDREWNDGKCTRYSGTEQESVIDGTLRFARFLGVWVIMFGLAVLCCSLLLSCKPVTNIIHLRMVQGVCIMLSISMLLLLVVKKSSICRDIGQETECTLGSGGLVAIAGSAMWLTAFILASVFVKVGSNNNNSSNSKADTKSKATERSGSQQSTIQTDLKMDDEFLKQTRSKGRSPKNKKKKVFDDSSGGVFEAIDTESQKAVDTNTLVAIKADADKNISGLPRSTTLQRILSLGQKTVKHNNKEEDGIEVDTIPEEIFQISKKSKRDHQYHGKQQQQPPEEIINPDNNIMGYSGYDETFDDVNLDDNAAVEMEKGDPNRSGVGSHNFEFDLGLLDHPQNATEVYTDEYGPDDVNNSDIRRPSRGAEKRSDTEIRRSSRSKERIRQKNRKISRRNYVGPDRPRSNKYSSTIRGNPSSEFNTNNWKYDSNRSYTQNSETHSAYVRRSEASILGKSNSIIASQASDDGGADTIDYREPCDTDNGNIAPDNSDNNGIVDEFRDDIDDDASIVDEHDRRRRRRDRRQRRRLSKRREHLHHQDRNDRRRYLDDEQYMQIQYDEEDDNLSAACTRTVCSVVDLTIDKFDRE